MNPYVYIPSLTESLPEILPDSIISRTLYDGDDMKVIMFGFAAGQELSEHTASMPATILVLQGEAALTVGGDPMEGRPGTLVHMTPNLRHSVVAKTPLVMLLLMLRGAAKA